jgi:hypothetical protein
VEGLPVASMATIQAAADYCWRPEIVIEVVRDNVHLLRTAPHRRPRQTSRLSPAPGFDVADRGA